MQRKLRLQDYTVGWVCALPDELAAAAELLDEEHQRHPNSPNDDNLYTLGCMNGHNVVIACLPAGRPGTSSAATVASHLKSTFTSVRFGLMVGIGGGVPSSEFDVRLGDVVISQPQLDHGGVIQYDFGKTGPNGFRRTGALNTPPAFLLSAVSTLRANHYREQSSLIPEITIISRRARFKPANAGPDIQFEATYNHIGGTTCDQCDKTKAIQRKERTSTEITVHYGTIASGNQVVKDGKTRDRLSSELGGVLCFEMEAAGLMNSFPCLVIRGICDYADSHKNKTWQPYAAATAAAYGKVLLSIIPAAEVAEQRTVLNATDRGIDPALTESVALNTPNCTDALFPQRRSAKDNLAPIGDRDEGTVKVPKSGKTWSREEDDRLLEIVHIIGLHKWKEVAQRFHRSDWACQKRYEKVIRRRSSS